jgi:hypothetical protein
MKTTISTLIVGLLSANAVASQHVAPAEPAAPAPAASAAPAATPAPAVTGTVARAQFTSAVQDREPTDNLTTLSNDKTQIYFYTELKNLTGNKVSHRWEHNGKIVAEQPFDVGAERWRVWSSKTLDPNWTGEWKVSVVDAGGATLAVQTFSYNAVATAPAPVSAPAPTKP